MTFGSIFLLALGLAMDATAVAAARGCAARTLTATDFVKVASLFGGFQAAMPLLGWFLGRELGVWVAAWDHWIAFTLLVGLGGKMLWEAHHAGDEAPQDGRLFALGSLTVLAIATSVDAFAVGITLPMLGAPLLESLVTIGVVTAVTSALGLSAGRRFGLLLGPRLDRLGGVILIALGAEILYSHLRGG